MRSICPFSPPAGEREHEVEGLHELELQDSASSNMSAAAPMITLPLMSFTLCPFLDQLIL